MGLLKSVAECIVFEHLHKNITGEILTIGRQTIHLSKEELVELCRRHHLPDPKEIKLDVSTTNAVRGPYVDDKSFFHSFSSARLRSLDHSDFEGADIVWDLNVPIPSELQDRFDFIYNGSVLDNIWDPVSGIRNMSRLLKAGGRIVHLEHGTRCNGPYLTFPPDWFHDYYSINNFYDCKTYVLSFPGPEHWNGALNWRYWDPIEVRDNSLFLSGMFESPQMEFFTLCIAEKGPDSTWEKSPNQFQYRPKDQILYHAQQAVKFRENPRPILRSSRSEPDNLARLEF